MADGPASESLPAPKTEKTTSSRGTADNEEEDSADRISCQCDIVVDYLDQRRKSMRPKKNARAFLARDPWGGVCLKIRPEKGGTKSRISFKCEENIRRVFRDFEETKSCASVEFLVPRVSIMLSHPASNEDLKELMDTLQRLWDDPLCADTLELWKGEHDSAESDGEIL